MRVVGYTRVSTPGQAQEGLSLDVQQRKIAAVCEERGWELLDTYTDAGESGAKWERPQLQRILAQIPKTKRRGQGLPPEQRPFDILMPYKLDRLARSVRDTYEIIARLEDAGMSFVSATEAYLDTTTPWGRALLGILAIFAELEREEVSRRVTAVMLDKAQRGEWAGRTPFGYRLVDKELVPDEEPLASGWSPAALVREAYRLYTQEHLGTPGIARQLTVLAGSGPTYGAWSASDVNRLLSSQTYLGKIVWNEATYQGKHLALVGEAAFERAQEIRAGRRRRGKERASDYLLSGILKCRLCGAPMTGHRHRYKRKSGQYEFANYACSAKESHLPTCRGTYISQRKAERLTIEFLRALSRQSAAELRELPRVEADQGERDRIEQRLGRLPQDRQRLIRMATRGIITEEELRTARAELDEEEEQLRATVRGRAKGPPAREMRRRFRNVADLLESSEVPHQQRKDFLAGLIERLTIEPDGTIDMTIRT